MSDRSKNIIAKEIINQTRIHFKKRRTELKTDTHTSKESFRTGNRKTEQKEKKTYNPSSNFTKIFGELTGEKSSSLNCKHAKEEKTSNVKCYPKLKNTQPEEIKINSNGKLNKTPKKETNNPPSIFQKLSHEPKQEKEITNNHTQTVYKTPKKETNNPPSIFQKLSQSKNKN